MKENLLVNFSRQFAIEIVKLCLNFEDRGKYSVLINQLLRCGTSIGANIHESCYAASRADFINKLHIALKECYECDYWLSLLKDTNIISADIYNSFYEKCSKIRRLLSASVKTAKQNS